MGICPRGPAHHGRGVGQPDRLRAARCGGGRSRSEPACRLQPHGHVAPRRPLRAPRLLSLGRDQTEPGHGQPAGHGDRRERPAGVPRPGHASGLQRGVARLGRRRGRRTRPGRRTRTGGHPSRPEAPWPTGSGQLPGLRAERATTAPAVRRHRLRPGHRRATGLPGQARRRRGPYGLVRRRRFDQGRRCGHPAVGELRWPIRLPPSTRWWPSGNGSRSSARSRSRATRCWRPACPGRSRCWPPRCSRHATSGPGWSMPGSTIRRRPALCDPCAGWGPDGPTTPGCSAPTASTPRTPPSRPASSPPSRPTCGRCGTCR